MLKPNLQEAKKRTKDEVLIETSEYIINDNLKEFGKGKTYFVKTYGCQMNEHDSETIKAILEDMSFKEAIDMESADLILLNTCAIRENVHNKVFGMIGRIKTLKEKNPNIIAGICGCMPQEENVVESILNTYKHLDLVFGTHNIHRLPALLNKTITTKEIEIEVMSKEGSVLENLPFKRNDKYKAWVNIMYGCDKFCTYCIVPFTRGKQRSRHKDYILKEVEELKQLGYQEVTLLGQNVNAYGKDLKDNYSMTNLLEDVAKTNIPRIRFVTSHPWDFSDEMVDVIAKYDNIMPYVHLPVQSGSNRVLKMMGRKYTKEEYLKLFNKIKTSIPNVSITTDIIVGFPSETEEDFKETIDLVNTCKFDLAFTFIFSKREGTPAFNMEDNTSLEDKKRRLQELNKLVNKYIKENNSKYQDKVVKVLLDNKNDKYDNISGYTDTMKLVNVKADDSMLGKIVDVKITNIKTWSMDGEIIVN
jgi:tRNA-2-methylthio-N6-dimethylallyladenosine synthase